MEQEFVIQKWSSWPLTSIDQASLDQKVILSSIPLMLRRRLSPLAKDIFCAIINCIGNNNNLPVVFSSSHGELAKSFKMMEELEQGGEISPTAFSLSVHNAIAGLFSIVYKNKLPYTVVAPGEEGIAVAFIEALGVLSEGAENTLVVMYDEPLVDFYTSTPFKLSTKESFVIVLLISKSGPGLSLSLIHSDKTGDEGEHAVQIPMLLNFLNGNEKDLIINSARHSWSMSKVD